MLSRGWLLVAGGHPPFFPVVGNGEAALACRRVVVWFARGDFDE